jgi:DNA repair exonuclease SbcCD ATPase subunit
MFIELEYVKFKNFLSYGAKYTTITIENGLNLICGVNGAGKSSSILDALSYNWFGRPYRNIKIAELINRTNERDLETESQFKINNNIYRIFRGIKPNKLLIFKNDQPLDLLSSNNLTQDEIDKILGIDYKTFKQIISLAVSYNKPFLMMDAAEKRDIIEFIFNIRIFGEMLKNLKKKISNEKVKYEIDKSQLVGMKDAINIIRSNIENVKIAIKKFDVDKVNDIARNKTEIEAYEKENEIKKNGLSENHIKLTENDLKLNSLVSNLDDLKKEFESFCESDKPENNPELLKRIEELNVDIDVLSGNSKKDIDIVDLEIKDIRMLNSSNNEEILKNDSDINENIDIIKKMESEDIDFEKNVDINNINVEIAEISWEIDDLEKSVLEEDILIEKSGEFKKKVMNLDFKMGNNIEQIEYLKTHDICEKCKSPITQDFKDLETLKYNEENKQHDDELDKINSDIEKVLISIDVIKKNKIKIQELKNEIKDLNQKIELIKISLENEKINQITSFKNENRILADKNNAIQLKLEADKKEYILKAENRKKDIQKSYSDKINDIQKSVSLIESEIETKNNNYGNKIKDYESQIKSLESEIKLITAKREEIFRYIEDTNKILNNNEYKIEHLKLRVVELQAKEHGFNIVDQEAELFKKMTAYKELFAVNKASEQNLKVYDISSKLLSESGIKSYFFNKLTPILNLKINEYLGKFDLPVKIKFNTIMEEEISNSSGNVINYNSFSEGEKKRIDISILMSFIDIAKIICNVDCNLLVIDELIDGQVDSSGLEKMIESIKSLNNNSIFVISHRVDEQIKSYFDRIINIKKVDGFSEWNSI